jgi:hypothetical protein
MIDSITMSKYTMKNNRIDPRTLLTSFLNDADVSTTEEGTPVGLGGYNRAEDIINDLMVVESLINIMKSIKLKTDLSHPSCVYNKASITVQLLVNSLNFDPPIKIYSGIAGEAINTNI